MEGSIIVPARTREHSDVTRIIATARVARLWDQQGPRMRIQFEPLRRAVEDTRYASLLALRRHFEDGATRETFISCSTDEELVEKAKQDELQPKDSSTVWSHLELAFGNDETTLKAELRSLCLPKLPGLVSASFSIGSLKGVTHKGLWKGSKDALLSDLANKQKVFNELLDNARLSRISVWLKACAELVAEIIREVQKWTADRPDFSLGEYDPLIARYKLLRCPNDDTDFRACATTRLTGELPRLECCS